MLVPTLYFGVLLSVFLLDHFIFARRKLTYRAKTVLFGLIVTAIVGIFWWFRNIAFGMEGPVNKHWGLKWRKVSICPFSPATPLTWAPCSPGTFITECIAYGRFNLKTCGLLRKGSVLVLCQPYSPWLLRRVRPCFVTNPL